MYINRLIPILISLVFFSCAKDELLEGVCATCRGSGHPLCQECRGSGECHYCNHGWMECLWCDGRGKWWDSASDSWVKCPLCQELGRQKCWYCNGVYHNRCNHCQGCGYLNYVCPDCNGTGKDPDYLNEEDNI